MTTDELRDLHRDSLLALKAYFAQSLDPSLCINGDIFQVEAARALNEATARELESRCIDVHLSPHADSSLRRVLEDLKGMREDRRPLPALIQDAIDEIEGLLRENDGVEFDQGDEPEEEP